MYPTEFVSVSHDYLGHLALCLVPRFRKCKDYVMTSHEAGVRSLPGSRDGDLAGAAATALITVTMMMTR